MFVISDGHMVDKYDIIKTKNGDKYIALGNIYLFAGDVYTSAIEIFGSRSKKIQIKVSDIATSCSIENII